MVEETNNDVPIDVTSPQMYEWEYTTKDTLTSVDFLRRLSDTLKNKDVVSVGEHHDLNLDTRFGWIQKYEYEILAAYDRYQTNQSLGHTPRFETLLRSDSTLLANLNKETHSFNAIQQASVQKIFALVVLPMAKEAGYTDILLEGLDERNPSQTLDRSKDKTGLLLTLIAGMMLRMNIHGAVFNPDNNDTIIDVKNALISKIKSVKTEKPESKIIILNGAAHNMTQPIKKGTIVEQYGKKIDLHNVSYVPEAIQLWRDRYGAIDLLKGTGTDITAHFKAMIEEAEPGITCYTHGLDQQTYVIK